MKQSINLFGEIIKEIGKELLNRLSSNNLQTKGDKGLLKTDLNPPLCREIRHLSHKVFSGYELIFNDYKDLRGIEGYGGNFILLDYPNGLLNYRNGIPNFAVTAIHKREKKLLEVLHYYPTYDLSLYIGMNKGVFLNKKRVKLVYIKENGPSIHVEFNDKLEDGLKKKYSGRLLANLGEIYFKDLRTTGSWAVSLMEMIILEENPCFLGLGLDKVSTSAVKLFFSELFEKSPYEADLEIRKGFNVSWITGDLSIGPEISKKLKGSLRPYPHPLPSVDAIVLHEGKFVFIWRRNPPFGWALPGGFVEYGETLEEAIVREVKEETGLAFQIGGFLGCYSDPNSDPRFHSISYVFFGKGSGELRAGDDALKVKDFSRFEIPWGNFAFEHEEVVKDYMRYVRT